MDDNLSPGESKDNSVVILLLGLFSFIPVIGIVLTFIGVIFFLKAERKTNLALFGVGLSVIFTMLQIVLFFMIFFGMISVPSFLSGLIASENSKILDVADIKVIQVFAKGGEDGNIDGGEDSLVVVIRINEDSKSLNFDDLAMEFETHNGVQKMVKGGLSTYTFEIKYLVEGPLFTNNFLFYGDLAELSFVVREDLKTDDIANIGFFIDGVNATKVSVRTPVSLIEEKVLLEIVE